MSCTIAHSHSCALRYCNNSNVRLISPSVLTKGHFLVYDSHRHADNHFTIKLKQFVQQYSPKSWINESSFKKSNLVKIIPLPPFDKAWKGGEISHCCLNVQGALANQAFSVSRLAARKEAVSSIQRSDHDTLPQDNLPPMFSQLILLHRKPCMYRIFLQ